MVLTSLLLAAAHLLVLLPRGGDAQGQSSSACAADVSSDGIVDVNDLLSLLSDFGQRALAAATIDVGGAGGWVVQPGNAAYPDIAASVGDTLRFVYSAAYHDVVLVDNADCDFSSGTLVDETGDLSWIAAEPGNYIFACARGDHCSVGNQRVRVVVSAAAESLSTSDIQADGVVDVNDLLALLSSFGAVCEQPGGAASPACALGEDCGGQLRQTCGTPCPLVCGQEVRCCQDATCDDACTTGWQCPPASPWWRPAPGTEPSIIYVGGDAGWVVQSFDTISARVGDTLLFVYGANHNLYLVDNELCDFGSAVAIDEYTGPCGKTPQVFLSPTQLLMKNNRLPRQVAQDKRKGS
eukprot:COSAG06_NODE_3264_length_5594_cov_5.444405_2_plen_352_part_00